MPHQVAVSVIAEIEGGQGKAEELKALLGSLHENRRRPPIVPFSELSGLHFARVFVLDEAVDLDGNPLAAKLVYLANVDAPVERHLKELAEKGADGLDRAFSFCQGYPPAGQRRAESRLAFLRRHQVKSQAFYVNGIGRSVDQIRSEAELRERIEAFLDGEDFSGQGPGEVRAAIQGFVRGEASLAWATQPAEPPSLAYRLKDLAHLLFLPALVLVFVVLPVVFLPFVFIPLFLGALLLFVIVLRWKEKTDVPDRSSAPLESIRAAREDEDFGVQNQIIAIGHFKRGLFRQVTAAAILWLTNWAARHYFTRGALSGLRTIHFARWVRLDGRHRMFFVSNYDGSLESYQNDFIDKAASGLNTIFSNGDGFPPTRFLFLDGIRDEQAYKRFLPTRQVLNQVWYSAYPDLSVINVNNNAAIRRDLFRSLGPEETRAWLRRL